MNIDTGELRRLYEITSIMPKGFEPIPDELQEEANELLGDKESVVVKTDGDSNLSQWRRKQLSVKEKDSKKKRRKQSKASKKAQVKKR